MPKMHFGGEKGFYEIKIFENYNTEVPSVQANLYFVYSHLTCTVSCKEMIQLNFPTQCYVCTAT